MEEKEAKWVAAVYKETFPRVARIIHQQGGDLDTAKDLFHDAMIIYLEKMNAQSLDVRVSASAYLVGITRILWIKKYKADSRNVSLGDMGNMRDLPEVPDDLYPEERTAKPLLHYLQAAGKKCMQLLQAFYYDRLSMQEIADTFQYRTRHSATVQKHKCLEKIREQVKHADIYEKATA